LAVATKTLEEAAAAAEKAAAEKAAAEKAAAAAEVVMRVGGDGCGCSLV